MSSIVPLCMLVGELSFIHVRSTMALTCDVHQKMRFIYPLICTLSSHIMNDGIMNDGIMNDCS